MTTYEFNFNLLLDQKQIEKQIEKEHKLFLKSINQNHFFILDLIKLNLSVIYHIKKIHFILINSFIFTNKELVLEFVVDDYSNQLMYDIFLNKMGSCEIFAKDNFNKYKLSKDYLLPIDFEFKLRSFTTYKNYLLSTLHSKIKDQIIFDFYKHKWGYVDTEYYAYLLFNQKIKDLDENLKQESFKQILHKFS